MKRFLLLLTGTIVLCFSLSIVVAANGAVMYSVYRNDIVVDGDVSEWTLEYPNRISGDNPDWYAYEGRELSERKPSEFSGTLYSAWNEDFLYFCGVIQDNDVSWTEFWNCDYFGLYFDALGVTSPGDPAWMDGHIWAHFRINPDGQIPPGSKEVRAKDDYMGRSGHEQIPGSKVEVIFTDGGYVFEVVIPWKELAFLDEPYESREIPFRILAYEVDILLTYPITSQYFWGARLEQHHEEFWNMGTLKLVK
ncbi:MAG: hypothetical protein PHV61_10835 [Limnochordia bacterium]|jgi:hypothetical protein|nr:hypothetical protein [Limnochordia bacterium]MDD2630637.1 hypothetical protein [Limnochordia bacterium]